MNHGFKLHPDGTLEITMPKSKKVSRVLVCEAGTKYGTLMYPDCDDCIKHGGDWECDRVHCHKGKDDDMISRQDAIDAAEFGITYAKAVDKNTGEVINLFEESNKELKKAVERIKNLPSAEPERKKGEWIYGENDGQDGWFCSECGFFVPWYYEYYGLDNIDFIVDYHICPNCDAEMLKYTGMRGEQE